MITFYSEIKSGILTIFHKYQMEKWVKSQKDGKFEITFKKPTSKRSLAQNNYIHLLFGIFSDHMIEATGDPQYTTERMKSMAAGKFLMVDEANPMTGEYSGQRVRSTTELSKIEMAEYFEKIIHWAAETFWIELPFPSENLKSLLKTDEK